MAEWGNGDNAQYDVDMQSPEGNLNLEVTDINAARSALKATNSNANGLALEVLGKSLLDGAVTLGQNGTTVTVEGEIQANSELHANDLFCAEAGTLLVGSVTCESGVEIDGDVTVGPNDAAGNIDSGGLPATPRDLNIGSQIRTSDVNIGRNGQDVNVADDLNVGGDCAVSGGLQVGPPLSAGLIDAGGDPAAHKLKIGTGVTTENVLIGRNGQSVDLETQTRLINHALITNDAAAITAGTGCGILHNANGQGVIAPSIDFYINGACAFYIDANGGHNA